VKDLDRCPELLQKDKMGHSKKPYSLAVRILLWEVKAIQFKSLQNSG